MSSLLDFIPAHLRDKYGLHAGDDVEVVEVGGALQIVRTEGAEGRGQRLARAAPQHRDRPGRGGHEH